MKKLGVLNIAGHPIEVFIASKEEDPVLANAWGHWENATFRILISDDHTHQSILLDTIMHEALHALLELSGIRKSLAVFSRVPYDSDPMDDFEECFIQALTPHLMAMLLSFKKLK